MKSKRSCVRRFAVPIAVLAGLTALFTPQGTLALDPTKAITQYIHDIWQTKDGLPSRRVAAIDQTSDGYLWIGTQEGLARFDGVRFTVFNTGNTPALGSNDVRALLAQDDGSLWIGTYGGGLTLLRDGEFTTYTTDHGLVHNVIYTINQGRDGSLWIGTGGGLSRLQAGRFTSYTVEDGLANNRVFPVHEDTNGELWIGTYGGGLSRLRDEEFTTYAAEDGLGSDIVLDIHADAQGNIWVSTYGGGLTRFTDGRATRFTTEDGLSEDRLTYLMEDRDANLWIGTYDGGLARMRDGEFSMFTSAEGLSSDLVLALFEDREGSLWIGTSQGLNRLRDSKVTAYTVREGLSHDRVYAVLQDREGTIWIGTEGGGLGYLRDGIIGAYTTADGLASDNVVSLMEDRAGGLWIGTVGGGVSYLANGEFKNYTTEQGLPGNVVYSMEQDRNGAIWIGTSDGLSRLSNGGFVAHGTGEDLGDLAIRMLHEDRAGNLWIGTNGGGVTRLTGGEFVRFTVDDGLASNFVYTVHEDSEGVLWFGMKDGGLSRLKDGRFFSYTPEHGLPNASVLAVVEDDRANLWLAGPRQLSRVAKRDLDALADGRIQTMDVVSYGEADGIRGGFNGGSQPSGWKGDDGRLWFASESGVVTVNPDDIPSNPIPPPVHIERIVVDGQAIDPGEEVELAAGSKNIEFHYAGLSLLAPEQVNFRYRLEGFDEEWVEANTRRAAYYTNIPPGRYTFTVIASNNDGVWNEAGDSFSFRLRPHFFQTWWFYLLCAVALALVAIGVHRLGVRHLRRRERMLSALVEERTRGLAEANRVLERLSALDALTGVANRRRFEERLAAEWDAARAQGSELAAMMIDIDFFKAYNDRYGHPRGDQCLERVAAALRQALRGEADMVARYGGEEFVVLLPRTGVAGAAALAERLRSSVESLGIPHETSDVASVVTISVGLATVSPAPDGSAADLIAEADRNLYRAKEGGRNQVRGLGSEVFT
jgi:diguanylate cyclase (GGDEF)-like protein